MSPPKIVDRQVGRNAELFAERIGEMDGPETRYPYLRILISIIEQAHPEIAQAPEKDRYVAHLVRNLSKLTIEEEEVVGVVNVRDEERAIY
jgi:hypothetical protein